MQDAVVVDVAPVGPLGEQVRVGELLIAAGGDGAIRARLSRRAMRRSVRDDAEHSLGSHWHPFAEEAKDISSRIPEMLPAALLQTGYGEDRKPSRAEPEGWAKGLQLVWPHGPTAWR